MSELTAKHLHANGSDHVVVANRTLERAQSLAEKFRGDSCTMEQLPEALLVADIVISSTGANGYVLGKAELAPIMKKRKHRPLFMVDIAVPRDLNPDLHDLDNVYLYDIDDLEGIVASNVAERSREAERLDVMIEEEIMAFTTWYQTLGVAPLIAALREKALTIQGEAMRKIENKLPNLSEREIHIIRKTTKGIVNQLMHDPVVRLKEMAATKHGEEVLDVFSKMFALEEILERTEQEAIWTDDKKKQLSTREQGLVSRVRE